MLGPLLTFIICFHPFHNIIVYSLPLILSSNLIICCLLTRYPISSCTFSIIWTLSSHDPTIQYSGITFLHPLSHWNLFWIRKFLTWYHSCWYYESLIPSDHWSVSRYLPRMIFLFSGYFLESNIIRNTWYWSWRQCSSLLPSILMLYSCNSK